jgi:predicted Co/Zn/Cd cation transporter (cation efflux family)
MDKIESKALKVGVLVNLVMAIAGWITYSLTNSDAMLLDGNFSFIATLSLVAAVMIVVVRHNKSEIYPFGNYFYESFFVFFKGILILGITIGALFQNTIKIIDYFNGEEVSKIVAGPIIYYVILMTILCFGVAYYFGRKNKAIGNKSSILDVERKGAILDGFLSMAVGLALYLTTLIDEESKLNFLLYVGDATIVVLMCLFLMKMPLGVIKGAFRELGGGVVENDLVKRNIQSKIEEYLPSEYQIKHDYITKLGSSYLIVIYLSSKADTISVKHVEAYRKILYENLKADLNTVNIEVVLDNEAP